MRNFCILAMCLVGCLVYSANSQEPTPEPEPKNRIMRSMWEIAFPESYDVKITLNTGEVIKLTKVAFTRKSLEKKIIIRALDHTIRIIDDEGKMHVIKSHEFKGMEITKTKEAPKPELQPPPVSPVSHYPSKSGRFYVKNLDYSGVEKPPVIWKE